MVLVKTRRKRRQSVLLKPSQNIDRKGPISTSTPIADMGAQSENIRVEKPNTQSKPRASLDKSKVKSAVQAVLKLMEDDSSKDTSLFSNEACSLQMQIVCVKVPMSPDRQIRFLLPHSLVTDTSDVCLLVGDLNKGKKEDHDPTVLHYQDLLERSGVSGITKVIPVRQIKVEYDQYELKRRLCGQFDFFLSDARVSGHLRRLLGKEFVKKRKYPTPVRLDVKNLKREIERGLSKTVFHLHGNGNSSIVTVGHNKLSLDQLVENIMAVADGLAFEYPGGWDNIRSLFLKTPKSIPVPLYLTLKSSNLLEVPRVAPKRPKAAVPVEDELSTFPGARVKVLPSGKVIVMKDEDEEDDSDTELNEILKEFSQPSRPGKKKAKRQKKKKALSGTNFVTSPSSIQADGNTSEAAELARGDDSEAEMDNVSVHQLKKNVLGNQAFKNVEQEANHVAVKEESDDNEEEDDDDKIEAAESTYLSQMLQENSDASEEVKNEHPQSKERKPKVFKASGKVIKLKNVAKAKPKSFMKIKKKNYITAPSKMNNIKTKKQNMRQSSNN